MEEAEITLLFERFKTIFSNNDEHPLGCIRFCLYLFMNGHTQETFNRLPAELKATLTQANDDIGTDIATEKFLDGPIGPYKNVMAKEYLAHLKKNDLNYFERLKIQCHQDTKLPSDQNEFDKYVLSISDYSVGRDYMRGGEGRRIYDAFKIECWKWYDEKYKKQYEEDPDSVNKSTLLTLVLCHLISRINLLAKGNQHIVDVMNLKSTFRKNAGTPKNSFIQSDLFTPRVRKSYLMSLNNHTHPKDLTPTEALDYIKANMITFLGDLLTREEFYRCKRQTLLPTVIQHDESTQTSPLVLFNSFWDDQEDIELLLLKLTNIIQAMITDTTIIGPSNDNLVSIQQLISTHKIYYNKSRPTFTELYNKLMPEDFYSPLELENTLHILSAVNILIAELRSKISVNDGKNKKVYNDLIALSNQIEKHIDYHVNSKKTINIPYHQYDALYPYLTLNKFIDNLLIICNEMKEISTQKDLVCNKYIASQLVKLSRTNLDITSVIDDILKLFTRYLTVNELKEIIFTLVNIKADEFEVQLIKLCMEDLRPKQLAELLPILCADKISPEEFNSKAKDILASSYSEAFMKIELKKLCQPTYTLADIDELLRTNIITYMQDDNLKYMFLTLTKKIYEEQKKKPMSSTLPMQIPKARASSGQGQEIKGKKGSHTRSGTFIPVLTIEHQAPVVAVTTNQAVAALTVSDRSTPTLPIASPVPAPVSPLTLPSSNPPASPTSSPKASTFSVFIAPLNLLKAITPTSVTPAATPTTSPKLKGEETAIPIAKPAPEDSPKSKKIENPTTGKKDKEEKDKKGFFASLFSSKSKKDDDVSSKNKKDDDAKIRGASSDNNVFSKNEESADNRKDIQRRQSKS